MTIRQQEYMEGTYDASPTSQEPIESAAPPWEEIAPGRFQPRRTRGSYRGRELG
jgi:hypothetical protein